MEKQHLDEVRIKSFLLFKEEAMSLYIGGKKETYKDTVSVLW
jgi:hypothetical protein